MKQNTYLAKTFYGLETVLAKEIQSLGGANVNVRNRLVSFEGDLGFLYKANFCLHTALRILKPLVSFEARNEQELYEKTKKFPWEKIFSADETFIIHSAVFSQTFSHSKFATYKVKDAIVDRFKEKFRKRPDIDRDEPDFYIDLHISRERVNISLNSSGAPLNRRNYRQETGEAPINEVLAAGLLKMSGWDGKTNLLDPMCGSGTILIEAAMMAANIPSQLHREHFAFQKWRDYDSDLFDKIKETRLYRITEPMAQIMGIEQNLLMSRMAERNIKSADLEDFITITKRDFYTSKKEVAPLMLIFNPPYNERLKSFRSMYERIEKTITENYPNCLVWYITPEEDLVEELELKPFKKFKVLNGKIPCLFMGFDTEDIEID